MIMQFTGNAPVAAGSEPGMLQVLSQLTADVTGGVYPFFSGFIGAFGAFIAGSNTVSDILFGLFQFEAAQQIGAPTRIVVAAQAVGGAVGNLVAIHNVVTTLTVVGLVGEEGRVIRLEPIPNGSAQRFLLVLVCGLDYVLPRKTGGCDRPRPVVGDCWRTGRGRTYQRVPSTVHGRVVREERPAHTPSTGN